MFRAGIGWERCHSNSKYSPTSSALLSWCSLGGGRGMNLFCVSRQCSLRLLLTTCPWLTVHRRDWEEAALLPPPSVTFLFWFMWAAAVWKHFTVWLLLSTCGASADWWREERSSSAGGALMGGSADSGWDWGCWTEGGRACLSWDSSSSSRGSTRPPSTASSAACWDWLMCRASLLCPTAYTRWARWELDILTPTKCHTAIDSVFLCVFLFHMCQHEFTCVLPTSTHFLPYHVFAQLSKHMCITSPFERHKLANITTQRTHSVYSMSNLTAQSIMGLCVDTVKSFGLVELMMCMLLLAVLSSSLMYSIETVALFMVIA